MGKCFVPFLHGQVEPVPLYAKSNRSTCQVRNEISCSSILFFLISKKNILKEPQGNKRPSKYREGHKQRESKKRQNTNGTNKN